MKILIADGEEMIGALKNSKPDIAFVDIKMPKINGLDAIKKCKESLLDTIFIIISSYEDFNFAVEQIKNFAKKNYMKNIGIAQIAYELKLTPNYLSFLFHKKTGIKFMKYLTDIRMEKAKEKLNIPGIKIHQVSESAGFNNSKHFTKIFLKYYNCIPSEYIKNQNKV